MHEEPRVAYLTSVYPRASDTFIRNEIAALRRQGVGVETVAIRRPDVAQLVDDELRREAASTSYLLDGGMLRLCWITAVQFLVHPIGFLRAARLLFSTHAAGLRNRMFQAVYLAEAACLARHLSNRGISHVHNHIGENSATVAMIASEMSELTYSMTIHGPGIFFHPRQWALGEKIERSEFTACISNFCKSQCMIFTRPDAWQKLRVVRCGIDPEFFVPQTAPPTALPKFVCVGRLCPEKGHLLLLEAVKRLVDEGTRLELHMIGDGQLRAEIEEFVSSAGLQTTVILHGWSTAEQIREQLVASRALILASFAEGLPVVFMEALAMERPVISTRIAGIAELIKSGENGWLLEPADADSLCVAIRKAIQSTPADLQRMGKAGAKQVAHRHDSERESAKLRRLFSDVLGAAPLTSQETLERIAREQHSSPLISSRPSLEWEVSAAQG